MNLYQCLNKDIKTINSTDSIWQCPFKQLHQMCLRCWTFEKKYYPIFITIFNVRENICSNSRCVWDVGHLANFLYSCPHAVAAPERKSCKKKQRKNCVSPITINITNCNVVSRIISHLYTPLATTMMKGKDMSPPMPNQRSEVLSTSRSTGFELGGWSSLKGSNFKVTISESDTVLSGSWVESPSSSSSSSFVVIPSSSFSSMSVINLPSMVHSGP